MAPSRQARWSSTRVGRLPLAPAGTATPFPRLAMRAKGVTPAIGSLANGQANASAPRRRSPT